MINDIIKNTETRMKKCIESFKSQIKKIHIGRISSNILDDIKITHQNEIIHTPLRHLANIIIEDVQTLAITVFDSKMVAIIEKTIIKSNLKLNIHSNGNTIRVSLPILTKERRDQLIKLVHIEAEKAKISIRNVRRSVNEQIKILIKNKMINQEKEHFLHNKVQNSTNIWIKAINELVENKTIELQR